MTPTTTPSRAVSQEERLASRRRLLGGFTLAAIGVSLSACGFRVREAPSFAFSSIYIGSADASTLGNEIKRTISSGGAVQLVPLAQIKSAQVILEVLQDQREKVVLSYNSNGQVREFLLRYRFRFRLSDQKGKELIAPTDILQQREISFNETAVLSKEAEEGLLYRNMQSDIARQLLRRLAAVKDL